MVGTGATARYHWMEMDADIATPPPTRRGKHSHRTLRCDVKLDDDAHGLSANVWLDAISHWT